MINLDKDKINFNYFKVLKYNQMNKINKIKINKMEINHLKRKNNKFNN